MSTWSVWSNADRTQTALVEGDARPRFSNGTDDPEATVRLWLIEAATYEEAATIHHLRMGWGAYKPVGPATPCPSCGAMFYPEGSGFCSCGNHLD